LAAGFLAFGRFLAAAFLAVLRAVLRFAAVLVRFPFAQPPTLRETFRFLAADFPLFFFPPSAAFARFIAAVAALFIFFNAAAAPDLVFLFLDFAMIVLLVASPVTMNQTGEQRNT